jgi:arylsulfatase A-like enzyme
MRAQTDPNVHGGRSGVPKPRPGRAASAAALLLLAALLVPALSCAPRHSRPNVVVIVIDTLRPDHLPMYGYEKQTAPFLASLARRGVVFDHVHSTSSWTAPATASIFTSLYPTQHGVREGFQAAQARQRQPSRFLLNALPGDVETLGEVMKKAGYHTSAVSDNINISPLAGFDQGFEHFWYSNDAGAKTVNERLKEEMKLIREKAPYLLYLHYMDPHRPYQKWAPWYEASADSVADEISAYDSEIRHVDDAVAAAFREFGWDRNTLILVTADHGEEFQDHGGWDHGRTLYAEVTNVPMFVFSSADSLARGHVQEGVSLLDVVPTLRAYAGLPAAPLDQGVSLLPTLRGTGRLPSDRVFYADLHSAPWFGSRTIKSVIRGPLKYIRTLPDREELYDLSSDPHERRDLQPEQPAIAAELWGLLNGTERNWRNFPPMQAQVDLNSEQIAKLRSLGYIN